MLLSGTTGASVLRSSPGSQAQSCIWLDNDDAQVTIVDKCRNHQERALFLVHFVTEFGTKPYCLKAL